MSKIDTLLRDAAASIPSPSLIPEFSPPVKEEEIVPDLKDLIGEKKDLLEIKRLVALSLSLGEQANAIKKARDPLTARIKTLLGKYKVGKAQLDDARINYFGSERSTIKANLLLGLGVAPKIIQQATEISTVYTLKISAKGEKEES